MLFSPALKTPAWTIETLITLYGIKNCDTVKKARNWLQESGIDYRFHDFREDGIERSDVAAWIDELGWETIVNRRSTTWKQLDAETRDAMDATSALEAVLEHPTLVKRPLIDTGTERAVGFKPELYRALFEKHTL